jgi:hypothetical protein
LLELFRDWRTLSGLIFETKAKQAQKIGLQKKLNSDIGPLIYFRFVSDKNHTANFEQKTITAYPRQCHFDEFNLASSRSSHR